MVNVTEASGVSIAGVDVTIAYDSSRFTIGAISLGSALAGFAFSSINNVATPGLARLVYSTGFGPVFAHGFVGTLLNVTLTAKTGAKPGASAINLTAAGASDNDSNDLTIAPAITAGVDSSDGVITFQDEVDRMMTPMASNSLISNLSGLVPIPAALNVVTATLSSERVQVANNVLKPTNRADNRMGQSKYQATDAFFGKLIDDHPGNVVNTKIKTLLADRSTDLLGRAKAI